MSLDHQSCTVSVDRPVTHHINLTFINFSSPSGAKGRWQPLKIGLGTHTYASEPWDAASLEQIDGHCPGSGSADPRQNIRLNRSQYPVAACL